MFLIYIICIMAQNLVGSFGREGTDRYGKASKYDQIILHKIHNF